MGGDWVRPSTGQYQSHDNAVAFSQPEEPDASRDQTLPISLVRMAQGRARLATEARWDQRPISFTFLTRYFS